METRSFILDKKITSCFNMGGSWSCSEMEMKENDMTAIEEDVVSDEDLDYVITEDGTKMVAGTNTECYKLVANDGTSTTRYCIASDGAPLYIKSDATSDGHTITSELIATSYTKSVSDSDFIPPAKATPMGANPVMGGDSSDPCAACAQIPEQYRSQCLASCGG
jgi:hypothetical protein